MISRLRLRHLLFVAFTIVSVIPVLLLALWVEESALDKEIEAVQDKHLLLARNMVGPLSRYTRDVEAFFKLVVQRPWNPNLTDGLSELLENFHFDYICIADRQGKVTRTVLSPGAAHSNQLAPQVQEFLESVRGIDHVVFSNVMSIDNGRPVILLGMALDDNIVAVGALKTNYLREIQQAIAFDEKGHAAIVDHTGAVLAHPFEEWVTGMKDISQIEPVNQMIAGRTGVSSFYSPAAKTQMIAGYSVVPATGWGIMIPQPMQELVDRARDVIGKALGITLLGILIAGLFSWWLAGWLSRPILAVARAAQIMSRGQPIAPIAIGGGSPMELSGLTESFNTMLKEISTTNEALQQETEMLQVTLDNMVEGITLVDSNHQLVLSNHRFREFFDLPPEIGHEPMPLKDVLGNLNLKGSLSDSPGIDPQVDILLDLLSRGLPFHTEYVRPNGRVIQLHGNPVSGGGFVTSYADITERKLVEEKIQHLAGHDSLTDLPNRVLFRERLEDEMEVSRRHGESCALLYLDLNQFKDVNDTLGHGSGDLLLVEVATRLREIVLEGDSVARLGGDEFAVVRSGFSNTEELASLARKLIENLSKTYWVAQREIHISAAIGITIYPQDAQDAEQLIKNADLAMYASKATVDKRFMFYTPQMDVVVQVRKTMEDELLGALERGEMLLNYQPILEFETDRIRSVEALLRWQHPRLGLVLPEEFIPLAESSGMIIPLGKWVLRQACSQIAPMLDQPGGPDCVSVNLSPVQFRQEDLLEFVEQLIGETGIAPRQLELEITESSAMHHIETAVRVLEGFNAMGIMSSIDDFGTGHSSLSQLKRLPVSLIKMDKVFVSGIGINGDDTAIVDVMLDLSRSLQLPILAEGVESRDQFDFLHNRGCNYAQGNFISKPLSIVQLKAWFQKRRKSQKQLHSVKRVDHIN